MHIESPMGRPLVVARSTPTTWPTFALGSRQLLTCLFPHGKCARPVHTGPAMNTPDVGRARSRGRQPSARSSKNRGDGGQGRKAWTLGPRTTSVFGGGPSRARPGPDPAQATRLECGDVGKGAMEEVEASPMVVRKVLG